MHRTLALLATCLLAATAAESAARPSPVIAAASDLQFALDEILTQFKRDTGVAVRVTYGSSGNFARQIEQGAPFELFLSADESFVFALAERKLTRDRGALYAVGRIVLFTPAGSPLTPDPRLEHLARRLADGSSGRIAIANPEHAPYGRAAQQALHSLGLWAALQPHVVLGENVSQAAQFATSGDAAAGLFAYSLTFSPAVASRGRFALVPDAAHAPLRQRMALVKGAGEDARAFYRHLQGPAARGIFARYGFSLPGP